MTELHSLMDFLRDAVEKSRTADDKLDKTAYVETEFDHKVDEAIAITRLAGGDIGRGFEPNEEAWKSIRRRLACRVEANVRRIMKEIQEEQEKQNHKDCGCN